MAFDLIPYLPQTFNVPGFVALLTISLLLIFAGSKLISELTFLLVGLIGGLVGVSIGYAYFGTAGGFFGFAVGFLLGGFASVVLLPVGVGIAIGYVGFAVAKTLIPDAFVAPLVGLVAFAYGLLLTDLLMPAITGALGGAFLYDLTLSFGMPPAVMLLVVATVTIVGVLIQTLLAKKIKGFYGNRGATGTARNRLGRGPRIR